MIAAVRRRAGWMAILLLLAGMPVWTSCYGKFPLTRSLYEWNGAVSEDKFVKSAVMWVLLYVPVYGLATLGDALIFNLYEFWTGKRLEFASTRAADGAEVTIRPAADRADVAYMTLSRDGRTVSEEKLVRISDSVIEVYGQDGHLKGRLVRDSSGHVQLIATNGTPLSGGLTRSKGL
jgi:hypothetical protein